MTYRLVSLCTRNVRTPFRPPGSVSSHDTTRSVIANRDIVGFGWNGQPEYADRWDFPFPALRWMETTPDIVALREKERGDWRKLTLEERKCLYRANFRQTFSEFTHPPGDWKPIIGGTLFCIGLAVWLYLLERMFVYSQNETPKSFSIESKRAQLRRMIDIRNEVISGVCSKWDYERNTWKK